MLTIDELRKSKNIATLLNKNQLADIAHEVIRGYEIDEDSRSQWTDTVAEAMEIAMQIIGEPKDFPFPNASNIKYPLIASASIDYASRTAPDILRKDRIVKMNVNGMDPNQEKYQRAERVCSFMSYDLVTRSPDWVDGSDKLLQVLPVLGTVFKKTYYNEVEKRICSDLCIPSNIVVNFGTQSLDAARRITHLLKFYKDDVVSRQRKGMFLEEDSDGKTIDIDVLCANGYIDNDEKIAIDDQDRPLQFLEQHCYLDLDEDGYREPYIVTVHKPSGQIFRIVPRFKSVETNKKGQVVRIVPEQCFTDYHFIRSPDGGFYSIGFGSLLLPLNKSINSLFNMLIDAGTMNNVQGGIIGSGIRLKNGELTFKMGRFQQVSMAAGEEIAKNIYPWPTKEPSQTLFQLLGLLMQVGKDLSASTDIMSGKQPAQNVASNTVSQLIEQGTTTFIAINQRVLRSFKKEYQKIYYLNYLHLSGDLYAKVLDNPAANVKVDFDPEDMDISPCADAGICTESQRMMKASMVMQLPTVDPREASKFYLQSMQLDQSIIDKLLPEQDPNAPPPPEQQKVMAEIQQIQANIANLSAQATLKASDLQLQQAKVQQDLKASEAQIAYYQALVWKLQQDALHNLRKDGITETKMQSQESLKATALMNKSELDKHAAAIEEIRLAHDIAMGEAEASKKGDTGGTKD